MSLKSKLMIAGFLSACIVMSHVPELALLFVAPIPAGMKGISNERLLGGFCRYARTAYDCILCK